MHPTAEACGFYCFPQTPNDIDKTETLRSLSLLLDSQLDHLMDILAIGTVEGSAGDLIKEKYKDVEKGAGETTRAISDL